MRLILATHGRLVEQDRMVREGRWAEGRPALLKIPRLRGLTLGLIAFGHVARAVAERAKPFGLQIIAYDPFIEEMVMTERGVEPVSLPELLARADIISMHSPATASAQRMIREEHFRQMKPTAIYISTGRGPTTDETALIKALDEKMIAAAGLDVLEQEPPGGNNPLLEDGQRDPDRACRLRDIALRSVPAPPRRPGIVAGADRAVADVLRQPLRAGGERTQALAAGIDGARPELVAARIPSGPLAMATPDSQYGPSRGVELAETLATMQFRHGKTNVQRPLGRRGRAPIRYPDPNIKVLDPRFQKYVLGNAAIERIAGGMPLHRRAVLVRRRPLPAVQRHPERPDHEMGRGDRRGQRLPQTVELRQRQHPRPAGPAHHLRARARST